MRRRKLMKPYPGSTGRKGFAAAISAGAPWNASGADNRPSSPSFRKASFPQPASGFSMSTELFPGFESHWIDTEIGRIFARSRGDGPPLVLLHGFPQTHAMWHHLAP